MLVKYTDNYGKKRMLEVPDDTPQSVMNFLEESERKQETTRKREGRHRERTELSDEELFNRAVQTPSPFDKKVTDNQINPQKIQHTLNFISDNCTEKQKRRYYLYTIYHFSLKKIAYWETTSTTAVWKSIQAVKCALKIKFST